MLIDLGEARDAPVVGRPPPWPRSRRRAAGTVAMAVALLATIGAASPVRSALAHATIPVDGPAQMWADGDQVYVLSPIANQPGSDERTVAMYRLPSGRMAWRVSLPSTGPPRGVITVAGVVLVVVAEGQTVETVALRPDTGQVLWRRPGWWQEADERWLVLWHQSPGAALQTLTSVAPDTGQVRWSLSMPQDELLMPDSGRVVRWPRSGPVEVRDLDTGAVLVAADVPRPLEGTLPDANPDVQVSDGLLLVAERTGERPLTTAYGLDRLDRRWQAEIDLTKEYVSSGCGDALCVGGVAGGVRLVDRATGRIRWSDPRWGYLQRAGPYLIAFGPPPEPKRMAVLDPATGRQIGDLESWDVSEPDPAGRMLGVRMRGDRAWIAVLDPALAPRVLGVANGVYSCAAGASAVICRHAGGSVGILYPRRKLEG